VHQDGIVVRGPKGDTTLRVDLPGFESPYEVDCWRPKWLGQHVLILPGASNRALDVATFAVCTLFVQVQGEGVFKHGRVAIGPQASVPFTEVIPSHVGIEIGPAIEGHDADHATTTFVHFGPYVSLGFIAIALRADVPVHVAGGGRGWNRDIGSVLTLKIPIDLDGKWFDWGLFK
jgi:hypothetical protein